MKTVDVLNKNNINASEYLRGPAGGDVFIMRVRPAGDEGMIRVWEGTPDIEVIPEKKMRQAVVQVQEDKREITKRIRWQTSVNIKNARDSRTHAIHRFPIQVPDKTSFSCSNFKLEKTVPVYYGHENVYSVDVTAKVPSSFTNFLVGMDETYHFISELPQKAESVEHAHEILRPRNIRKDSIRVGEWFFVPVSKRMNRTLMNRVVEVDMGRTPVNRVINQSYFEYFSDHYGMQVMNYDNKRYAIGFIMDNRRGRHKPVFLPTWHQVVRNRERHQPRERARYYD